MTFPGWERIFPLTARFTGESDLVVGGLPVRELAQQYGTPLYLYDGATLRSQVTLISGLLAAAYPGAWQITYAAKAYFSRRFAAKLAALGVGVDVVSLGELEIARQAGFAPSAVHLHGNNKTEAELRAAIGWGVQSIVVDSLDELAFLDQLAGQAPQPVRIWLRLAPGIEAHTHAKVQTANHATKFGLPVHDGQAAEALRRAAASPRLRVTGLHVHLGSQIFEPEPYQQAVRAMVHLAQEAGVVLEEISPGGGWGVPYTEEDGETDPRPWIQAAAQTLVEEAQAAGWPLPRLVVEPGRWLAARAGLAVYTVGAVKTAGDGTRMVAVDGGMADNPRPALYQSRYSAALLPADATPRGEPRPAAVVGRFCESGDQLIPDARLPEARRGDLLVMPAAGAYQLSMASNYNLAPRPAVLWLEGGQAEVLQPREEITQSGWWVD